MHRLIQRSAKASRSTLKAATDGGSLARRLNDSRGESLALDLEFERSANLALRMSVTGYCVADVVRTTRYKVSRSIGSRPAARIRRSMSRVLSVVGVREPAMW
jgi:hypothetical protein